MLKTVVQSSPKESIHLCQSQVLKSQGDYRRQHRTKSSNLFEFQNEVLPRLDQLIGACGAPLFSIWSPSFLSSVLDKSGKSFFSVKTLAK